MEKKETAILLLSCPDKRGIVAQISQFIFENNGNIIYSDQHTDPETSTYFMRIEWELEGFKIEKDKIGENFFQIAEKFGMDWILRFSHQIHRSAIFVSKFDHCLYDILLRHKSGELKTDIKLIISNHPDLENVARNFDIEFIHFPIEKSNKPEIENKEIALIKEKKIDLIILARYMQILSAEFVSHFENRIINIHHSFLPAFVGAKPYHQAYSRGVKIIGATSHYVTAELDKGPIIEQDVARVSHRDTVSDLVRKGRDLEKLVLSRAVKLHLENKVLVFGNKTVVFD
jgi:formyltetrahydrofolate deformylase